ncbi:MAG: S41 family peptidase [Bacteroidales bacterium]|nr:S41 family peptidase [Bacteroidales bacterium]HNW73117.1 S41 family peptidase [Bacteroidales bacterium]HPS50306.1 S41 family peptidase [Bacteroidales bacterium]
MKTLIYALSVFFIASCYAQEHCNCEKALTQLILKVEAEYPGYAEKTKDKPVYDHYKAKLLSEARSRNETDCEDILKTYLQFFKDGHLSLIRVDDGLNVVQSNAQGTKVSISREEFQKRINNTSDPLEGVWRSGSYKVGIIRVNKEYQGFIIEADTAWWKPDEIKFRLFENGKANYYLRDHTLSEESWELSKGWILYFDASKFFKELPMPTMTESEKQTRMMEIEGCYFRKLSEKTSLLCFSSFEHPYLDKIKKLMADNIKEIERSENLIIDVRNNGGGVYEAYADLFPYILTNKVRGMGIEFKATQTLIDGIQDWYDDAEGKKQAGEWIVMFREKMGEFVNPDTTAVSVNCIKLAEKSPRQIVILANRRTASSGEAFLLDARQSKKVKILGTPTYGALDYGSASFFNFGCKNYKLMMPTWRSMRLPDYPIDNIGIQPDIYLDNSVKDWVAFAVDYLENK